MIVLLVLGISVLDFIKLSSEKWLQVASNMIEYSSYNYAFEVEIFFFF